jgi:hypothetical protein
VPGSDVPLWKKLGVVEGARVRIVGRPPSVTELATPPPWARPSRTGLDVIVLFATHRAPLASKFPPLIDTLAGRGGLWVAWPKKPSQVAHDLDFNAVQKIGLAAGLVDNKVCRIDDDWQALRFVRRLKG